MNLFFQQFVPVCDYVSNENIDSDSEDSMQSFLPECVTNNCVGNQVNITSILLYLQNGLELNSKDYHLYPVSCQSSKWQNRVIERARTEGSSYLKNLRIVEARSPGCGPFMFSTMMPILRRGVGSHTAYSSTFQLQSKWGPRRGSRS